MLLHFISDLHLEDAKPGITKILLRYLENQAREADALYLLGDIFEYWLGDDVSQPRYRAVCDALKELTKSGTRLFFMRGNRDFLVGDVFAETTGCQLLEDPHSIQIGKRRALVSHGDMLCTDDIEHQHFRQLVSQPEVRARLLSLTGQQREQMAQQLRGMSKSGNAHKAAEIMDVTQSTVESLMTEHEVDLLIHGHTHRCATHDFELHGKAAQRVVLSDWHEDKGNVLVCDGDHKSFRTLT